MLILPQIFFVFENRYFNFQFLYFNFKFNSIINAQLSQTANYCSEQAAESPYPTLLLCLAPSTPNSLQDNVLWSGINPVPGLSSSKTLFPPAWISSMARVWVIPWVGSPLISTIWSPTWGKKSSRLVFRNLWHCELLFNLIEADASVFLLMLKSSGH